MDQERTGIYVVTRKLMRNMTNGEIIVNPKVRQEIEKELAEYLSECDTVTSEYSYIKERKDV